MQSIKFRIVLLALFSCSVSGLRNCGEFEKDEIIDHALKESSKPLPYQNEIDQLFDAFDENDSQRMEKIYQYLANTTTDELDDSDSEYSDYAANRIKHVVSLHWKRKESSEFQHLREFKTFEHFDVARSHQSTWLSGRRPQGGN